MSVIRKVLAEAARQVNFKSSFDDINCSSAFVVLTSTGGADVYSASLTSSGDGYYYANILGPDVGSVGMFRLTVTAIYGTLADSDPAPWKSTAIIEVVAEGEN